MNIKKLFAILAGVSMVANVVLPGLAHAATPDTELGKAYEWAYSKSITTMPSYEAANMKGKVTRAELAKMLSNWAMNVRGMTPDTSKTCEFTDTASVKGDLGPAIKTSCQLGLMGQGIPAFRPYDNVSRAEFGTALSRALWGGKYDGGTPYYKNHLQALQAAGIMNYIDGNWPASQEVRGYVMLMLMRVAEDTVDPETPSDEVVKSGDLTVTATPSTDRKIIVGLSGGVSDTDTLTFKTSENVEITKITLERYGFSDGSEVISGVRLEDADGNVIADSKELNSKDQVTLSVKKDYRKVDGTFKATIVVETNTGSQTAAWGTMWFKVTDVQSTAKNLNLDDYKPYNYDLVVYNGTKVELSRFGNDKDYNYEAGEMYEVARFRVKANNSAVLINGFTLTNNFTWWNKVDLKKNLDKLEVTANGEKVSAKYSVNKDDQLVITLSNEYELAAKKSVSFVVNASLADFEDYGYGVKLEMTSNDLKAIEKKTETRVSVDLDGTWAEHTFRGGKIKLTDAKIADAEGAAGSVGVVIAEWEITLGESIRLNDFVVTASTGNVIDAMTLVVAGEEYDGKDNKDGTFTFSKVIIEKSGKVQFKVDLKEEVSTGVNEVMFTISSKKSLDKAVVSGAKYEELRNQNVAEKDVSGSIKFVTLKVQVSKGSLENTMSKSKAVEFIADRGGRQKIFDGTYTAKKGDITLTSFWFEWVPAGLRDYITLYVTVANEEGNVDTFDASGNTAVERFADIKVKKDESVKVIVEADISSDIEGKTPYPTKATFDLYLQWEDADGNDAWKGSDSIAPISVKDSGSVIIPSGNESNTVKLKGSNESIAYFTVKPANGNEGIYLDELTLTITGTVATNTTTTGLAVLSGEATYKCPTGLTGNAPITENTTCADDLTNPTTTGAAVVDQPATYKCPDGMEATGTISEDTVCSKTETTWAPVTSKDIRVNIWDDKDVEVKEWLTYKRNKELPKEWVVVEVVLKGEADGVYEVTANVNKWSATKTFNREFLPAIVNVVKQTNRKSSTLWNIEIEAEDDVVVTNIDFLDKDGKSVLISKKQNPNKNDTMSATNLTSAQGILTITYDIDGVEKFISRNKYEDFFIINEEDLMVYSSNS